MARFIKVIINGTLTAGGSLGGFITSSTVGATLNCNSGNKTTFISIYHAIGTGKSGNVAYKVSNYYARGYINSTNSIVNFEKGTYTSNVENNVYYWNGTAGSSSNLYGSLNATTDEGKISCITADTLITLIDGSKKMVKDLTADDLILVFNHETGKFEASKYIFKDVEPEGIYRIINVKFSDGTIVKVVYEHGFFDLTLNKYVYINESNMNEYIGHKFYKGEFDGVNYQSSAVELVDVYITEEYTSVYSPVTAYHLNYFTEDMLSMPAGIPGLFNIFEFDENLTYDKELMEADIEKYGLYTYDDFKEYIPYEIYEVFQGQYLKVSVGKGYTTYEDIIEMIYLYLEKHGLTN